MNERQNKVLDLLADFLSDNDVMFDNYSIEKDGEEQISAEEVVEFLRNKMYNNQ